MRNAEDSFKNGRRYNDNCVIQDIAVRHIGADEINIAVHKDDNDVLMLEISDNGSGFDSAHINHETLRVEGHRGLASMTERMSLMGGTLKIVSKTGEGTTITASFKI